MNFFLQLLNVVKQLPVNNKNHEIDMNSTHPEHEMHSNFKKVVLL